MKIYPGNYTGTKEIDKQIYNYEALKNYQIEKQFKQVNKIIINKD